MGCLNFEFLAFLAALAVQMFVLISLQMDTGLAVA
jgi:hypothetical protein